jgi:hypothetical protein
MDDFLIGMMIGVFFAVIGLITPICDWLGRKFYND